MSCKVHKWRHSRLLKREGFARCERKCRECKRVQHARVEARDFVPDSLMHLVDVTWSDGELPPEFDPFQGVPFFGWTI